MDCVESQLRRRISVGLVVINVNRFCGVDVVSLHQNTVDGMAWFQQLLITGDYQAVKLLHEAVTAVSHRESFM